MTSTVLSDCVEELTFYSDPTPAVTTSTRLLRRARAEQLDEIHAQVGAAKFYRLGFRSPTDWLATSTRDSIGQCKITLHLAARIQVMPVVKAAFTIGDLAESALRLLAAAWNETVADTFERDEELLCQWATSLSHDDFKMVLDTWRLRADPDREERTKQEQFDSRALHLSALLDGVGRLDGTLDPEGLVLVREAIRALSLPCDGETRTAAQRRADALVSMAKIALTHLEPIAGKKRRRPKVVATTDADDLADATEGGTIESDHDRIVVPAESIRRISCDCSVHRLITGPQSTILDYGRAERTVSDSLFDVLTLRDHGCRWDGCGMPASACDAHHVVHWADGGETEPDNLALVCWHHHHFLHEQHWSIQPLGGGHFISIDPHGGQHPMRPPTVGLAPPAEPSLPLSA